MFRVVWNLKCEVNEVNTVTRQHYHEHPPEFMRFFSGQLCICVKSSLESQTEYMGGVDKISRRYFFLSCNRIYQQFHAVPLKVIPMWLDTVTSEISPL